MFILGVRSSVFRKKEKEKMKLNACRDEVFVVLRLS